MITKKLPRAYDQPLNDIAAFEDLVIFDEFWRSRRTGAAAPNIVSEDLLELPNRLVPRVCIVDAVDAGTDFRYRFWGTRITEMHHKDFTGRSIREVPPAEFGNLLFRQYSSVFEAGDNAGFIVSFENDRGIRDTFAVSRYPLSSDGSTIDRIISIEQYGEDDRKLRDILTDVAAVAFAD